jgi:hypothetical protein
LEKIAENCDHNIDPRSQIDKTEFTDKNQYRPTTSLSVSTGFCRNGVAQWSSHLPWEHKIHVRISPGCKFLWEKPSKPDVSINLICIVCVFYIEKKGVAPMNF